MNFFESITNMASGAFSPSAAANSSTAPAASAGASATGADTGMPGSPLDAAINAALPRFGVPNVLKIGDVTDNLPPRARRRLMDLRDANAAARAVSLTLMDRRDEANVALQTHRARLKFLLEPQWGSGAHPQDEDSASVRDVRAKIEKHEDSLNRIRQQLDVHGGRSAVLSALVSEIESYLRSAGREITELPAAPKPSLKKGENLSDAIEARRRRLRELSADRHRTMSAPWPSNVAKAKARAEIERLVAQCRPSVEALLETRDDGIGWPGSYAQTVNIAGRPISVPMASEPWRALPWLFQRELIAAIEREIDACADDAHALTAEQRAVQLATIAADMLAVEREEVALLDEANAETITVLPRSDVDPRAVLGLADTMPAPDRNEI